VQNRFENIQYFKTTEKPKMHKLPGTDQIPAELIKESGRKICSETHKLTNAIWNEEELPEQQKESIIVSVYKRCNKTD
jgi:hypothetical protein